MRKIKLVSGIAGWQALLSGSCLVSDVAKLRPRNCQNVSQPYSGPASTDEIDCYYVCRMDTTLNQLDRLLTQVGRNDSEYLIVARRGARWRSRDWYSVVYRGLFGYLIFRP